MDGLQDGSKAGELELLLLEHHHAWQKRLSASSYWQQDVQDSPATARSERLAYRAHSAPKGSMQGYLQRAAVRHESRSVGPK
jgi:hypothetical protein